MTSCCKSTTRAEGPGNQRQRSKNLILAPDRILLQTVSAQMTSTARHPSSSSSHLRPLSDAKIPMHQSTDTDFDALLAFVDECELHELDQAAASLGSEKVPPSPAARPESCDSRIDSNTAAPKQKRRPGRDATELADLRSKVTALELRLAQVIQTRESIAGEPMQLQPQIWKLEAERQSVMRSAAQRENAGLKSMLQAQIQVAKSLMSSLKRNSRQKILQTLHEYERSAATRDANDHEDDAIFQAYLQTDKVIAEAELPQSEPSFFDAQFKQHNGELVLDFRGHHIVACDLATVNDALWRFDAGDSISRRFQFDQDFTDLNDTASYAFTFQSKEVPSPSRFQGQALKRKFTSDDRVVIVWKSLMRSSGNPHERLRMHGTGWMVIERIDANTTRAQHFTRLVPESSDTQFGIGSVEDVQQDTRVNTIVEFMLLVAEAYASVMSHMTQTS